MDYTRIAKEIEKAYEGLSSLPFGEEFEKRIDKLNGLKIELIELCKQSLVINNQ